MIPSTTTDLDRMLADAIKNMPAFRPVVWHEPGMDQFRAVTLDATTVNHFVRDASIELLYHGYRQNRIIGFVLTSAAQLMRENAALLPKAGAITALKLVRLAWKRDMRRIGENEEQLGLLSREARLAYRAAEELAKRRPMRLDEEDALKLLLPKAAA